MKYEIQNIRTFDFIIQNLPVCSCLALGFKDKAFLYKDEVRAVLILKPSLAN